MSEESKKPAGPKNLTAFKEDDLAQKGRTKHVVETDWPTKEVVTPVKKRKVKKTHNARLP